MDVCCGCVSTAHVLQTSETIPILLLLLSLLLLPLVHAQLVVSPVAVLAATCKNRWRAELQWKGGGGDGGGGGPCFIRMAMQVGGGGGGSSGDVRISRGRSCGGNGGGEGGGGRRRCRHQQLCQLRSRVPWCCSSLTGSMTCQSIPGRTTHGGSQPEAGGRGQDVPAALHGAMAGRSPPPMQASSPEAPEPQVDFLSPTA